MENFAQKLLEQRVERKKKSQTTTVALALLAFFLVLAVVLAFTFRASPRALLTTSTSRTIVRPGSTNGTAGRS